MELQLLGKKSVSHKSPAGVDVRYDPDFEALQAEIDKLVSIGTTDWKKVSQLASQILDAKSKDLLAASYLAVALIYIDKIDGLNMGLTIYQDILTHFWDDLFPLKSRMRGRISAVKWWIEKTEIGLKSLDIYETDKEKIDIIQEKFDKIEGVLTSYLEEPPSLVSVKKMLKTKLANLSKSKPKDSLSEQKSEQNKLQQTLTSGQETQTNISQEDIDQAFTLGCSEIRKSAMMLREIAPQDPKVYKNNRIAVWARLNDLPPVIDDRTGVHAPEPHFRKHIKTLQKKENWDGVLETIENSLNRFIFWLDLNYFAAQALEKLGQNFIDARKAVCTETAILLYRLPGLENLLFLDGSPFASEETKSWLQDIELHDNLTQTPPELIPVLQKSSMEAIEKEIKKAKNLGSEGNKTLALKNIQAKMHTSLSQKESLKWRTALAQLLLEWNQPELAMPHLTKLFNIIKQHDLENWDPNLAVYGLKVVWQGFSIHENKNYVTKAEDIINQIALIDPGEALKLKVKIKI